MARRIEFVFRAPRFINGRRYEPGDVLMMDCHLPRHVTLDKLSMALRLGILVPQAAPEKPQETPEEPRGASGAEPPPDVPPEPPEPLTAFEKPPRAGKKKTKR